MMELALNLGMPFEQLARVMTEREFKAWVAYRNKHQLPLRRLEFYLAQIACQVARSFGGADASIEDFIIKLSTEVDAVEEQQFTVEEAQAAFGFAPKVFRTKDK